MTLHPVRIAIATQPHSLPPGFHLPAVSYLVVAKQWKALLPWEAS